MIVAGSRTVIDYMAVREMLLNYTKKHPGVKITWITGRASEGPDDMVYHFAKWDIPGNLIEMKADWDEHGKSAGFIRNAEMGDVADELILVWDGRSNGSGHMRDLMRRQGKTIDAKIVRLEDQAGRFDVFDFTRITI